MALNVYKRALPLIRELARNSFLTAATAFVVGVVVARIFFPSSKFKCPMKPLSMKAVVFDPER